MDSSFPSSIRFPAGFELEPDCIWRSSLFGISLASCNGKFLRVPDSRMFALGILTLIRFPKTQEQQEDRLCSL